MGVTARTKPVKIKFNNQQEQDSFVEWAESTHKNNSKEMKNIRAELDRIRQFRKEMAIASRKYRF